MSDTKPWDILNPNEPKSQEDEYNRRMSICEECPFFLKAAAQCKKCGCFMKLKSRLDKAHCPIGKW